LVSRQESLERVTGIEPAWPACKADEWEIDAFRFSLISQHFLTFI